MLQSSVCSPTQRHCRHAACNAASSGSISRLPAQIQGQQHTALRQSAAKRSCGRDARLHNVTRSSAVAEAPAQEAVDDGSSLVAHAHSSGSPLPPPQRPSSVPELPPELRDVTAVLTADNPSAPGGRALVYVLGMSHVSRRSVEQVEQLIRMVQPEVVMVELCKDRVTALVDRDAVELTRSHVARVKLTGLPAKKGWPSEQQLLALVRTRPGEAVAYQDIEEDPSRLLSTGLFRSCRPVVFAPKRAGEFYPTFLQDQETGALKALRPIGAAEFVLSPRQLPPIKDIEVRLDSSLRALNVEVPSEALEHARKAALEAATRKAAPAAKPPKRSSTAADAAAATDSTADGTAEAANADSAAASTADMPAEGEQQEADAQKRGAVEEKPTGPEATVDVLMALRADLLEAAEAAGLPAGAVEVVYQGTDSSRVEAVLRAVPEGKAPSVSGLESTAPNGDGEGIEPFRPQPRLVEIGLSMRVPLDKVAENLPPRPPPAQLDALTTADLPQCRTPWQRWTEQDAEAAEEEAEKAEKPDPSGGVGGMFASFLTSQYAKFQDAAGLTVGVETGEAWRAAFRAASDSGSALLLLGDRPSAVTARRMGDSIFRGVAPLFGGACAVSLAADIAAATGTLPDGTGSYAVLAGLAAVGASLLPIIGPILEVRALSKLPADRIEEAAAVPEPLQNADGGGIVKLWGEDALLDWPGAMGPVIDERDVFMAKTLAAAATGSSAVAPALAADVGVDGAPLWRYVMGRDGPAGVSPCAEGDGRYEPLPDVGAVVAVVGTAHVWGIMRAWEDALRDQAVAQCVD